VSISRAPRSRRSGPSTSLSARATPHCSLAAGRHSFDRGHRTSHACRPGAALRGHLAEQASIERQVAQQTSFAGRVRYHFAGNAEGSTLRLTLGCLFGDQLGIRLTRVGSGSRYTFTNPGEIRLDTWLEQNAAVCWVEHPQPWELEEQLLKTVSLPLNIDGNDLHPFIGTLGEGGPPATRWPIRSGGRYAQGDRAERGRILDEFAAVTGFQP
jgi:hypothetical protein